MKRILGTKPTTTTRAWESFPIRVLGCALLVLSTGLHVFAAQITDQKVTAFDMAAGDIYGAAVAVDGELAIVCNEWDDPNGLDSGSIYAYHWNGTQWQFDQKFSPADNQLGDNFGRSVCMQDGVAVVGTHWDDDKGLNSGSVYVLEHDGNEWVERQKLTAADGQPDDRFGNSVSLDGDWLAVSAWLEDQGGNSAGAVYLFRHNGSAWVQDQKLLAPDAAGGDNFGRYVSVSGDKVLIGAWKDDVGGGNSGSAYVFRHDGENWVHEQKLVAFDRAAGDLFGWVCSLRDDVAVVGAYADDELGSNSGSVYIYRFNGSSWVLETKLLASDGVANDWFGYCTAISGNRLLVAATGNGSGRAFVYRYDGAQWVERARIAPSDGADQDKFGFHVAISGGVLLSGAWRDDDAGPDTGSAYFYRCKPPIQLAPSPDDLLRIRLGRFLKTQLGFSLPKSSGPPSSGPPGAPRTPTDCW